MRRYRCEWSDARIDEREVLIPESRGRESIGYPEQPSLTSRAGLFRNQPEPGAQVPGLGKTTCIANRSDQGRCVEHANARDGSQPASCGIITCQFDKFAIQRRDFRVELFPFGT